MLVPEVAAGVEPEAAPELVPDEMLEPDPAVPMTSVDAWPGPWKFRSRAAARASAEMDSAARRTITRPQ